MGLHSRGGVHYGPRPQGNEKMPAIATGGTETVIEQDGKYYRVHSFTDDGSLNVTRPGQVEYLVVAGGGGGGYSDGGSAAGGGGGAGGLILSDEKLDTVGVYTIQVGSGGQIGSTSNDSLGDQGSNSGAFEVVSIGGGGGGGRGIDGGSGGSGGGGGSHSTVGGSSVSGQGQKGGDVIQSNFGGGADDQAAGGGGYSEPGETVGEDGPGGDGGDGLNLSLLFSTAFGDDGWFAGGGAGGDGGSGGNGSSGQGGGGDVNQGGSPATGGGGGGNRAAGRGIPGPGGSGIVIVRYRISQAEYDQI